MRNKIEGHITSMLLNLEQKSGYYFSTLIIAFILLVAAAIYVTPSLTVKELGRGYATLSINPFDLSEQNNLRNRILTPSLAYFIGLRGNLYIFFPIMVALFFLSSVYLFVRKKLSPLESFYTTLFICFSTPILFLLHFQGYVDVTSYFLIMLIITFIKKSWLWIPLMALLLLNHESNLFILPALIYLFFVESEKKVQSILIMIVGVIIAILPLYFYRTYISEVSPVEYSLSMYTSQIWDNIKTIAAYSGIGIFYAFKLFWIIPVLAFYYYWKEKNWQEVIFFLLILFGALGQLLLASDTSRLMGLAFPLLIFSAFKLKEIYGSDRFLKVSFYLILINFLIPQFYVGQSVMIPFYPLPVSLLSQYCFGITI